MKYLTVLILFAGLLARPVFSEKIVSDAKMDSLCRKADAFIIDDSRTFTVLGPEEAELRVQTRLQINNKNGEKYGRVYIRESDFISVDEIEAAVYDLDGSRIKELNEDDIEENTLSPGDILYQKNRNISFHLRNKTFPYILEINFVLNFQSLFFWPDWYPQQDIPVKRSQYKLILEESVKFNSFYIGKKIKPVEIVEDGDLVYLWLLQNIPEIKEEDFMPPENKVQQAVLFSPQQFILGKSSGSFDDWDSFARWYHRLTADKYHLPQDIKKQILQLTKDKHDPYDIITTLYKYLQDQTRYVAIYLDIGGWEPHPAQMVYKKKYGDCKDLTTLMISMLQTAGIKAYPALVLTRDEGIVYPDFVGNQFNHSIAFVPLPDDTVWLECTADYIDMTDMPSNIEDVNVLVVKNNKGEIIRTPKAPMTDNMWVSCSKMEYNHPGMLLVDSRIETTGKQKRWFKNLFTYLQPEKEKVVLQKAFSEYVPNLTIQDYAYREEGKKKKSYIVEFKGIYKRAVVRTGKRLLINPNVLNRKTDKSLPDEDEKDRTFPVHYSYPYQDIDTVYIKLPFGYTLESAPKPVSIDLPFARYKTDFRYENRVLRYIRTFAYKNNDISLEDYPKYYDFLKTVIKNDRATFVFKK